MASIAFVACHEKTITPTPTIYGKWNWVKNVGGITGNIEHTPKSTGHQLIYFFNTDFSCIQINNQDTVQNTTFKIAKDTFHLTNSVANILTVYEKFYVTGSLGQDSTVIVEFRSAYSFKGDSLVLKTDQYDGYTWWYLREKSR